MVGPGATGGLDTAPRRIFLAGHQEPIYGADGFVLPTPPSKVLTAADLLTHAAVLVLAPPWTGKTFVADQLERALKVEAPLRSLPFAGRCALTSFERLGRGAAIQPAWWDEWRQGRDRACWIVDAIDEDDRRGDHRVQEILERVEELQEEERSRLHLLFFARLNEVPARFQSRAQQLFGDWSPARLQGLRQVRLAGLDREAARGLVGPERFERVCLLIETSGLRELAAYPAVLEYLRERVSRGSGEVTREEVWRGILIDLLRDRRDSALPLPRGEEVEDRFEVAQRLATLMTFRGRRELRTETFGGSLPDLEELLPSVLPDFRILRQAAREALKTAVFERTENGFRFAQDHVQEWFVAFALSGMPLLRVRPLLIDKAGDLNRTHEGVMGLLAQISKHVEVREWIATAHGGLAPPSDAAPWSLSRAIHALDRLQELAQSSPWGLRLWGEERVKRLNTPGIGPEIAGRLRLPLHPAEQELLLGLATTLGISEAVEPAVALLQGEGQDERVRTLAAALVTQMSTMEQLDVLSQWVRSRSTRSHDSALPILVSDFYSKGLWDFEATTEFVLGESGLSREWLQYRLAEDLSKDRSRWLIRTFLLPAPVRLSEPLLLGALYRLLEDLDDVDYRLLTDLALRGEEWEPKDHSLTRLILWKLQKNFTARRELFLRGLNQNPGPTQRGHWIWKAALDVDDVEWLLGIVQERQGHPEWLWEMLYWQSRREGVPQSIVRRVRQAIGSSDDHLLTRFDEDWETLRVGGRRAPAAQEQAVKQSYELASLVRNALADPDLTVCQKMRRLSWICFTKPSSRPTNVSGRWEDLARELQAEVLALCREALDSCTPTSIPGGMTYPSSIHWEAASFHRLVSEDATFVLTPTMIRKWLPALLKTLALEREWEPTLRACFATDQDTSQALFLEAVLREVQTEGGSTALVQDFPRDLWSEHLARRLEEEIVEVEEISLPVRIDFLARIGRVFPARAQAIALRWAETGGQLQDAGIDILLSVDPPEGWSRLRRVISAAGGARPVLLRMRSLLPHHSGPNADFTSWPVESLEELIAELLQAFPPGEVPESTPGEDDLRLLRDRLPSLLHHRDQSGDHAALERLAGSYMPIREWLDHVRAGEGAEGILSGIGVSKPSPAEEDAFPLQDLIRILQEERYRAVRTAGDLQAVVLQEIRLLSMDAKQHLAMLYGPKPRQKGKRKRLHEEALQAYLLCRLQDRLTTAVLGAGTRVFLDRETLAARNTRNDLKVQASSVSNERLTVVIEVKWSDNAEVSTSLVEQLGRQYLLENGLTHGIYLVGWFGKPSPWRGPGEPPEDLASPDAWRRALEAQAEVFRQQHPELHIAVVVLDLSWDVSTEP